MRYRSVTICTHQQSAQRTRVTGWSQCAQRAGAACDRLVDLSNARQIASPGGYVTGR